MSIADASAVIARYRDRSANYGAIALFDHLPMTVDALARMGAAPQRLSEWADRYAAEHQLRPAGANERASRERWRVRIAVHGAAHTIAQHGPRLANGIGAAAFHAAIRAAYALERSDDDDLAAALEAWEREYLELPLPPAAQRVPVETALTLLAAEPITAPVRGLIVTRMAEVGQHPRFATIAAAIPSPADIDALARAAAAAFAQSGDFTALHVMTGTHAMRVLAPYLPDPSAAMPGFWSAYAAAAHVAGAVPILDPETLDALRSEAPTDWEPLLRSACAHDDEHVVKSTYTAWRLDRALNDAVFRAAAQRYLHRTSRVER